MDNIIDIAITPSVTGQTVSIFCTELSSPMELLRVLKSDSNYSSSSG